MTNAAANCSTCPTHPALTPTPRPPSGSSRPSTTPSSATTTAAASSTPPHLGLSVAGHRTVLVDGRVTATWTVRNHQLRISSLRPLTAPEQEAVHAEAQDLATFLDNDIEHIQLGTEN